MKPLRCDFCNGALVMDDSREFAVCEFCGTKYLKSTIQQKIQEIRGTVSVEGVVQTKESDFLIRGGTLIKYNGEQPDVEIPNSVITIGIDAFRGLALQSVVIPSSVKRIEREAFALTDLSSVVIPNSVEEIQSGAFYMCKRLVKVVLPTKPFAAVDAEHIKGRQNHPIFCGCERLTSIINIQYYPMSYVQHFVGTPWEKERSNKHFLWQNQKRCTYCGGQLRGWPTKKCSVCNRPATYDSRGNWVPPQEDYLIIEHTK